MIQRSEHLSGPSNMTSISLAPVVPSQDFRVVRVAYKIQSPILKGKVACFANGPSISVFHAHDALSRNFLLPIFH